MLHISFLEPASLLGKSITVQLKEGGNFKFKVTGSGPDYIEGYDEESLDMRIEIKDVHYITGGN